MTTKLALPDIGEGVTEGEMITWLVKEGDPVKADQPVVEVMTDKATVEVPAPDAGVITKLVAKEGDIIPIGGTLLEIKLDASTRTTPGEKVKDESVVTQVPMMSTAPSSEVAIIPPVAESFVLASPSTRRFAREVNVDINQILGTGLAGRVTRQDVLGATGGVGETLVSPAAVNFPARDFKTKMDERVPFKGIRKKIAENLQMAKKIIPHFTIMDEANVTQLVKLKEQAKKAGEKYGVKVTYLPFVIKALVATLHEYPMFNASIDDEAGEIVYKKTFNIGFAADTPNGLIVPVIKSADQKSILELSAQITDLSIRARAGKLNLDEIRGATITITNIGSIGGTYATPIINHPEVAIIGMYKITKKPVFVANEKFKIASVMNYTVTADHRLIDGAVAANFLKTLFEKLENPAALMIGMV